MTTPSLGDLLRAFRQERQLTIKQSALHLGVPLDRLRSFEQDATLPTIEEVRRLCQSLQTMPHRLLRHVRGTGLALLEDAWTPYTHTGEAFAARSVPEAAAVEEEAVLLLPPTLQDALCDVWRLDRANRTGLQQAWTHLRTQPDTERTLIFDAALAQLTLEGETDRRPLLS